MKGAGEEEAGKQNGKHDMNVQFRHIDINTYIQFDMPSVGFKELLFFFVTQNALCDAPPHIAPHKHNTHFVCSLLPPLFVYIYSIVFLLLIHTHIFVVAAAGFLT